MDFEWDDIKAHTNEKKHGVSFLEAAEVFGDDYSSCVHDPDHSYDEDRYLLFGVSSKGNFLVVSYTERSDTIRIISARRMTNQERRAYER
ncbi:MAG: BrnT family toxin [Candidatus Contendobacter sp.]|nr:BrnT family toxin [Candidatus Contendobacter sp.]